MISGSRHRRMVRRRLMSSGHLSQKWKTGWSVQQTLSRSCMSPGVPIIVCKRRNVILGEAWKPGSSYGVKGAPVSIPIMMTGGGDHPRFAERAIRLSSLAKDIERFPLDSTVGLCLEQWSLAGGLMSTAYEAASLFLFLDTDSGRTVLPSRTVQRGVQKSRSSFSLT